MGYYVRAFCTSEHIPSIKELLEWAESQGCLLFVPDGTDLEARDWDQLDIYYKKEKLPFLSEINRYQDDAECLMRTEIEEFKEFLSEVRSFLNFGKTKVINHLNKAKYIVANQIPTSDFDDDGYNALGVYLQYFVKYCGGMVQADGEGFYEGNKLIVKLD